jgi:ribbon-helix-helix CopG family protein
MATTTIRSTYAFDVETAHTLERIARRWNVSKSEALRRAIRAAAAEERLGANEPLEALDRLQGRLKLTPARAQAWIRRARAERRASAERGEARGR